VSKNLHSLWMIGLGFGILFTLVAIGQYAFLRRQINEETTQELLSSANEMRDDIVSAEPWNLQGYRNSTSGPDTYIVVAKNGTLIDAHGFQSKMLPTASVPLQGRGWGPDWTGDKRDGGHLRSHFSVRAGTTPSITLDTVMSLPSWDGDRR
jgi:hypothetical protein